MLLVTPITQAATLLPRLSSWQRRKSARRQTFQTLAPSPQRVTATSSPAESNCRHDGAVCTCLKRGAHRLRLPASLSVAKGLELLLVLSKLATGARSHPALPAAGGAGDCRWRRSRRAVGALPCVQGKMAKSGVSEKVQEARDRKSGAKKAAADAAAKAKVRRAAAAAVQASLCQLLSLARACSRSPIHSCSC